jgi:hypothetical protein
MKVPLDPARAMRMDRIADGAHKVVIKFGRHGKRVPGLVGLVFISPSFID